MAERATLRQKGEAPGISPLRQPRATHWACSYDGRGGPGPVVSVPQGRTQRWRIQPMTGKESWYILLLLCVFDATTASISMLRMPQEGQQQSTAAALVDCCCSAVHNVPLISVGSSGVI